MKKIILLFIIIFLCGCNSKNVLPKPEITGGARGKLGIDKNINELTIDKYLNRNDSVYIDLRMLQDEANYEAIGGDSYLSGYIKGFEIVSLPYIINVSGLPKEVGNTYNGKTLFSYDENNNIVSNYEESMDILKYFFPKDKNIFLMCGGGGYAGMMKNILIELGWNKDKIYNVGGFWYYEGNNKVVIKRQYNNNYVYDFWKIPYHNIDFSLLHEVSNE